MDEPGLPAHDTHGRYVLFREVRSRYHDAGAMLKPADVPDDGLGRVIVDHHHPPRAPGSIPPKARRTREEMLASLRAACRRPGDDATPPTEAQLVALSAVRLCHEHGWLWAVGEVGCQSADVLAEAAGRDIAVLRTSVVHALVIYRVPVSDVGPRTVWLHSSGDYGLRLIGFDRPDTDLEHRLMRLEATARRDATKADDEWARIDEQRAARPRRSLREAVVAALAGVPEDVPPSALCDTIDQWDALKQECWGRTTLRALCADAAIVCLPDGPHHLQVSLNSLQRSAAAVTDALGALFCQYGLPYQIIDNKTDEYLLLSELQAERRAHGAWRSRQGPPSARTDANPAAEEQPPAADHDPYRYNRW